MPRRAPADYELIAQVYEETQSQAETARRLGLHYNTVYMALRRREGLCTRCGVRPMAVGHSFCEECRTYINERERRRRAQRLKAGECRFCGAPVDAPHSKVLCKKHRIANAAHRRATRPSQAARTPEQRERNRLRSLTRYGPGAITAWQRDNGTCQACGEAGVGKRMHMHHIDIDKTNNAAENLVVLCSSCHYLFHRIATHPKAGAVVTWTVTTYPDFAEKFHDLAARASTPTGRTA